MCSPGLPNLILFPSSSSFLRISLKIVCQMLLTITIKVYFLNIMHNQNRHSPRFGFMSECERRSTIHWDTVKEFSGGFSFLIVSLFSLLSPKHALNLTEWQMQKCASILGWSVRLRRSCPIMLQTPKE